MTVDVWRTWVRQCVISDSVQKCRTTVRSNFQLMFPVPVVMLLFQGSHGNNGIKCSMGNVVQAIAVDLASQ